MRHQFFNGQKDLDTGFPGVRCGSALFWVLGGLVVALLLTGGGYYAWSYLSAPAKELPPKIETVKQGYFVHEILERGSVDSASNVEIRSEAESNGGLTIISVVPEGTIVKKGDLLVELDSSSLTENVSKQRITVNSCKATVAKSEADLETAKLTYKEYAEGKFKEAETTIINKIAAAKEKERIAAANVAFNQRLLQRNYITVTQAQADEFAHQQAKNDLAAAELELMVLQEFTLKKTNTQNQTAIDSAQAKLDADKASMQLEEDRLVHLEEQLAKCKIHAPQDGQVVYYLPRWGGEEDMIKEGLKVYERQIILRLPDPAQMQVRGFVNEANIRLVKLGQKGKVRLEAFANQEFDGEVRTVNDYPERGGWMGGAMSKEYMTIVRINNPPPGIKPGLTAEVRIVVNEIPDALLLPVQAVFEYRKKMYVMTYDHGKWGMKEVQVGPTNDKQVVILGGLALGDEVVLGAWEHRAKLKLEEEKKGENGEEESGGEHAHGQHTPPQAAASGTENVTAQPVANASEGEKNKNTSTADQEKKGEETKVTEADQEKPAAETDKEKPTTEAVADESKPVS